MIRKSLILALFTSLATVGLTAASPSEAQAQKAHVHKKKTTKKRTTKRRTTKRRTTRHRHRHRRHRSGVDVRIHYGTRYDHHGHYRYHRPRYHHHRHTTIIRPHRQVVVVEADEPGFVPPELDCPIRTDEARLGLEQWCETPMGNRHGPYRRWYDDGSLAAEGEYEYDLREGVWIEFHPNGAVRREGEYDDGEKVGLWVTWGADGQELVAVEH